MQLVKKTVSKKTVTISADPSVISTLQNGFSVMSTSPHMYTVTTVTQNNSLAAKSTEPALQIVTSNQNFDIK